MRQIVPEGEKNQPQNQRQPKPKSNLLGPLTERPPQDSLASIVQKMAPVEDRNRKKVYQPDAYRYYSNQIDEGQNPLFRDVLGHHHDADRAVKLARGSAARDELSQAFQVVGDDGSRQPETLPQSLDRPVMPVDRLNLFGLAEAQDRHRLVVPPQGL